MSASGRVGRDRDSHSVLTRYLGVSSDQLYTRLPDTGFTQSGGHIAFTARAGASGLLSGLVLREEQTGVHRYHRMLGGDGLHRSKLEPQQLDFALLRYERGAVGLLDSVSATLSLNRQQDDRLEQQRPTSAVETGDEPDRRGRIRPTGRRDASRRSGDTFRSGGLRRADHRGSPVYRSAHRHRYAHPAAHSRWHAIHERWVVHAAIQWLFR